MNAINAIKNFFTNLRWTVVLALLLATAAVVTSVVGSLGLALTLAISSVTLAVLSSEET